LDEHVDRLRAGQFRVEAIAGGDRLFAVGNLIGEAIARLQIGVDDAEDHDDGNSDEAEETRAADHARGDPGAEAAQEIDAGIGASDFDGEAARIAQKQHAEQRQDQ
jgi:hypothetical protein